MREGVRERGTKSEREKKRKILREGVREMSQGKSKMERKVEKLRESKR